MYNAPVCLDNAVKVAQICSYIVAAIAAFVAARVYRANLRLERAKWVETLYSRFFEKDTLKEIRDALDCHAGSKQAEQVPALVEKEGPAWTDYLNFFEFVAYLQETGQIDRKDVNALFQYYLGCMRRHSDVMIYVANEAKGFKYLRKLLAEL